jgi:deoxyribonuclease-1-like protein
MPGRLGAQLQILVALAKCKCNADENCHYSYEGNWGSGELNKFPEFGCCLKPDKKVGTTAQRSTLNRNYGQRYAEADENFALFNLFFKNTEAEATDGYSFLLVIPTVLPEDVTVSGFARLELADIYRDETKGQTQIRLNSKAGFEALALDQKMSLIFALESSGETNVKTFADTNVIHAFFYSSRYSCFCAGNDDLCNHLDPPATKFASFNIQVFGQTKYGKEPVKNQIVEILQRYDISTIQEIRDSTESAFPNLVDDINAAEDKYDWFTGERQGTTTSKEQVGFIWDRNMFSKIEGYDFNDTTTSWFERPPAVLVLERSSTNAPNFKTQKVGIISAHLKPATGVTNMDTENEINHLKDVENDLRARHPALDDVIIAGDFNADCDYVRDPEDLALFSAGDNSWLISFEDDTTVSSTICAYDHIVLSGQIENNAVAGSGQVFDYQNFYDTDSIFYNGESITELISDHFPVEFEFFRK